MWTAILKFAAMAVFCDGLTTWVDGLVSHLGWGMGKGFFGFGITGGRWGDLLGKHDVSVQHGCERRDMGGDAIERVLPHSANRVAADFGQDHYERGEHGKYVDRGPAFSRASAAVATSPVTDHVEEAITIGFTRREILCAILSARLEKPFIDQWYARVQERMVRSLS